MKTTALPGFFSIWHRVRHTWAAGSTNERRLLATALGVALLALLWWIALGPALGILRDADAQHQVLNGQINAMRALAADTESMRVMPPIKRVDSLATLEQLVRDLGSRGRLSIIGERATVAFKDIPAEAFVKWLVQARKTAGAKPVEMHLTLNAQRTAWDGNVILSLPPP